MRIELRRLGLPKQWIVTLSLFEVRPSSRPYLLVVTDASPEANIDKDVLPLVFPAGFVLDCSAPSGRKLEAWGEESLPQYLVGSYDIQNDELRNWLRRDRRYSHLKVEKIIGITLCRFGKRVWRLLHSFYRLCVEWLVNSYLGHTCDRTRT